MNRVLVLLLVLVVVAWVVRRAWLAVAQLRSGAVPAGMPVPEVSMQADRGWQVTRSVERSVVTVRVEHPSEGVARSWQVPLREPGAARALEEAMRRAGLLVRDLTLS